jgi:hypothetical protein
MIWAMAALVNTGMLHEGARQHMEEGLLATCVCC